MEQNRWASATEACNLLLGLLIVSQFSIMFGLASSNAVIQVVPWVLTAYPMIIITVVMLLFIGWLAFCGCKIAGICVWASAVGFLGLSMMYLGGIQAGGLIGGIGLIILGIWLVYTGVGGVVNKAVGKQIFPLS